ncbi:uncharacterized protein MONBRDRAFT_36399, partial [Monosiga brevicollis MX1]
MSDHVHQFGFLERKPIRENGIPSKARRWTKYYAGINQNHLVFYYSKKDLDRGRSPALRFALDTAEVRLEDHARRGEVISFGNDRDRMLLQAPLADLEDWLVALLPADKSLAARRAAASPKETVKSRLNRWLGNRARKQDLMERGILQEPVFGGSLAATVEHEHDIASLPGIPEIVVKCITRIDRSLTEQGIYRVSGHSSDVQAMVAQANKDVTLAMVEDLNDVH